MDDAKAELDRRRSRGRLAQSAFRKRQAQARQDMQDENAKLKRAIGAIVGELHDDDRPALRKSVLEAARIAGLPSVEIKNTPSSNSIDSTFSSTIVPSPSTPISDRREPPCSQSLRPESDNETVGPQLGMPTKLHRDPYHYYDCTNWHASTLPFLGAGAFTFAGRIFWYLVEKFEAAKQDHLPWKQPRPSTLKLSPESAASQDQSPSSQYQDIPAWISLIEKRLASSGEDLIRIESRGASNLRSSHGDVEERENMLAEASTPNWLSPVSAEQRIRTIVGDDVFAMLATPVLERWEMNDKDHGEGFGQPGLLTGLLDILCESFVCFGDGPRWNRAMFDVTLRNWCISVIDQHNPTRRRPEFTTS